MLKTLNLGCGKGLLVNSKTHEYINVDTINQKAPNYVRANLLKPLPFGVGEFDQVYLFHCIEHIPEDKHPGLLSEIRRVLKDNGRLYISYPEFSRIAQNWLINYQGKRDFWKATIYGRGLTNYDRHISLMHTDDFSVVLKKAGFKVIKAKSEVGEPYNTILTVEKGEYMKSYQDLLLKECVPV